MDGIVKTMYISPAAGAPMQEMQQVLALTGLGLEGDRYAACQGSFSKGEIGNRQVTLMNTIFFEGSGFEFIDSRRNIFVEGMELMHLINREFRIGEARFHGEKYCTPCPRPSKLAGNEKNFKEIFFDRGGLIAQVIEGGLIKVGDSVILLPKKKDENQQNPDLKKYKILQTVMLSFIENGEQTDVLIDPTSGYTIECDDKTIWITKEGQCHESTTTANAIAIFSSLGSIEKLD